MDTREFLKRVLGESGFYCVLALSQQGKRRIQKFYDTLDDTVDALDNFDRQGMNAYFALATFEESGSRKAANAKQLRSLFMDLDCGPEKDFDDQASALVELRKFCNVMSLPRPNVVNSGNGLHVYWPFSQPVEADRWRPLARALKKACEECGFPADPSVTADAASVLRPPGTHNHKGDNPKIVKLLRGGDAPPVDVSDMEGFLSEYLSEEADMFSGNSLMGTVTDTTDRLLGNKESVFRTILQKTASGKGCAQIKHVVENQHNLPEPMWRAGLSIAKFCTDGHKAAHIISKGHPDYSKRDTEKKLDGIAGPYTCDMFDSLNHGVCDNCPLRGRFKSPIALGTEIVAAKEEDFTVTVENAETGEDETYVIPLLPKPYFRGRNGGVYAKMRDEEGDPYDECVYVNDLYFVRRVYDPKDGEALVARLHLPRDGVREFTVSLGQATSPEELRKVLSSRGVVASSKKAWEKIMMYANSWVSHLQSNTVADNAHRQFGWTDDAKMESFVLGPREIFADDTKYNPPTTSTAALMPAFTTVGTLDGWVEQANFFSREGMEPFQFMVCLTLAAPIMALTPYNAAMFSLYSDGSGHGKTTAQKIGLAAFGDPGMLIMEAEDTVNFRMNRMEILKNLPAQWDEMTNVDSMTTSSLLYQMQTGKQKGRMSSGSNAERVTGMPWKTTCGFTTNEGLVSKIRNVKAQAEGEPYRILEYHAHAFNFASKSETDDLSKQVGKHCGHVATPLIQHIIKNKEAISKMIDVVQRQIDDAAGLKAKDRFWSTTGAVTVTMAMIANKLGFVSYDPKKLRDWTVELILENKRQQLESTTPIETHITNYVTENYGSVLWIKSTEDRRGKPSSGASLDSLVVPEQQPRVKFVARFETDTKMLFLLQKPFQAWCAAQHLNYESVLKELFDKMGGKRQRVRIGKGTKLNLPSVNAIAVNCKDLDIDDGGQEL